MNRGRVEIGAVIAAAGLSSRFGGRPKALAECGGRTFLRAVVDKCRLAGVDNIKVVTGHHKAEVEEAARALEVSAVHNPDYLDGMFSSVKTGIREMAGTDIFFVWPVDAALTHVQTLLSLITAWRNSGRNENSLAVMVPAFEARTGHPPLFSGRCRDEIIAWAGDGGLRGWMGSLMNEPSARALFTGRRPHCSDGPVTFVSVPDEGIVSDIDTREDLAAAREPLGSPRPDPQEAWQLLLQRSPGPEKISHCRLVAVAAFRLALALRKAGFQADPELALLGGLLHDIAHDRKQHDQIGGRLAENMGWPEVGRVIGAHTDPPAALVRQCLGPAHAAESLELDLASGPNAYPDYLAGACLSVYLADKYSADHRLADLQTRFETSRHRFRHDPEARKTVDRRERTALMVEDWFRRRLQAEPMDVAGQASGDDREKSLERLRSW